MHVDTGEPRVLHVNTETTWRGGEQQMLYLLKGLHERGFTTAAVCRPGSPAAARCLEASLKTHEVRMRGEADLCAALRIARIARHGKFNILHAHTAHAHSLILFAAGLWRAHCRLVVHRRIAFPVGRRAFGLGRLKYLFGVDAYVAISRRVKATLLEAGIPEGKVFVVHSATEPARFLNVGRDPSLRTTLSIPEDAFLLGNIAYLVGHKDHRNLVEAARIARDEIPDLWLVIVGEGPLREEILEKARQVGMADRLVLTGFRADVPRLIRIFDLFALSSSEEGLCSTLLEVMASECPLVATNASGVSDAVLDGETGLLVPIRDPAALAGAILRMARDPAFARESARRGKERVLRQFTASKLAEETLEVYEHVLRGAPAAGAGPEADFRHS